VSTAEVAVITRFRQVSSRGRAGIELEAPFFDSVAGMVSLRVNQITLTMETKTKDNVFVTIPISVQNRVRRRRSTTPFYKLSDPVAQIKSYVEQVILGHVPGMTLDEVFASQSSIAAAVKQELDADMATFGYEIVNVLVTDIVPDAEGEVGDERHQRGAARAGGRQRPRRGGKDPGGQEGRGRSGEQGAAGTGHRQSAQGDHRRPAGLPSSSSRRWWKARRRKK
jgi:regulator of protease activity HflC (stomatin/prohibitin superfamily)